MKRVCEKCGERSFSKLRVRAVDGAKKQVCLKCVRSLSRAKKELVYRGELPPDVPWYNFRAIF